jgi:hypothetical protein
MATSSNCLLRSGVAASLIEGGSMYEKGGKAENLGVLYAACFQISNLLNCPAT